VLQSYNRDTVSVNYAILHVLAPGDFGGLESVVQALAVGQRRAGKRVCVVGVLDGPAARGGAFLAGLEAAGVETQRVIAPSRGYRREQAAVAEVARAFRPEIIHTHGARCDVVDGAVAGGLGLPVVSTLHGLTGSGWRAWLYQRLEMRAYRRFGAVVVVSRPLVERVTRAGVAASRIHLIPNAYLPPAAPVLGRAAARARLGIDDGAFAVGWVGRLSHEKGADVMVDALAMISTEKPVLGVFVGTGRESSALAGRASSLGARVRWAGAVPGAATMLSAFDVIALSSRTEGTPMILLEAMGAGVPIVATAVGGVPDVVTPAEALLVAPESPSALAGAIEAVRDDPGAAAVRAAAASRRLATTYAAERWLAAYDDVYRTLVN
jgi:glycosyltransferase involved in cell wall biosynthesis